MSLTQVDTDFGEHAADNMPRLLYRVTTTTSRNVTLERLYWAATSCDALLMAIDRFGHDGRHIVDPISKTLREVELDAHNKSKMQPVHIERRIGDGDANVLQDALPTRCEPPKKAGLTLSQAVRGWRVCMARLVDLVKKS